MLQHDKVFKNLRGRNTFSNTAVLHLKWTVILTDCQNYTCIQRVPVERNIRLQTKLVFPISIFKTRSLKWWDQIYWICPKKTFIHIFHYGAFNYECCSFSLWAPLPEVLLKSGSRVTQFQVQVKSWEVASMSARHTWDCSYTAPGACSLSAQDKKREKKRGVRRLGDPTWPLETDSTVTCVCVAASHFCPFTKPSGKGQVGRHSKCTYWDRARLRLRHCPSSLTVCTPLSQRCFPQALFIMWPSGIAEGQGWSK